MQHFSALLTYFECDDHLQATEAIQQLDDTWGKDDLNGGVHVEERGHLKFTVRRDVADASDKLETKIDASRALGLSDTELAERNLLKGITADESTTIHVLLLCLLCHVLKANACRSLLILLPPDMLQSEQ